MNAVGEAPLLQAQRLLLLGREQVDDLDLARVDALELGVVRVERSLLSHRGSKAGFNLSKHGCTGEYAQSTLGCRCAGCCGSR